MSLMNVVLPIFRMFMVILGFCFLSYAIFGNNNGLLKLFAYQKELSEKYEQLEESKQENRIYKNKNALLDSENPDPDLLEEVYREKFYTLPDDRLIILPSPSLVPDKVDQD